MAGGRRIIKDRDFHSSMTFTPLSSSQRAHSCKPVGLAPTIIVGTTFAASARQRQSMCLEICLDYMRGCSTGILGCPVCLFYHVTRPEYLGKQKIGGVSPPCGTSLAPDPPTHQRSSLRGATKLTLHLGPLRAGSSLPLGVTDMQLSLICAQHRKTRLEKARQLFRRGHSFP